MYWLTHAVTIKRLSVPRSACRRRRGGLVHSSGVHCPERGVRPTIGEPRFDDPESLEQWLNLVGHVGVARDHHLQGFHAHVDLIRGRPQMRYLPTRIGEHLTKIVLGQRSWHLEAVDIADAEFE